MTTLVWFRNDLRLDDHDPIGEACRDGSPVLAVACVDPRQFGLTSFGFAKTGPHRARFLQESFADLDQSLRERGNRLRLFSGAPEQVLPELVRRYDVHRVYFHREATTEERAVESAVSHGLCALGAALGRSIEVEGFDGRTLVDPSDLPFPVRDTPELFTDFRRRLEPHWVPSPPRPAPDWIPEPPAARPDEAVALSLREVDPRSRRSVPGAVPVVRDPRACHSFPGGESEGRRRLHHYFWEADRLRSYKETRNGLLHTDDSSKLSPYLALGCLSPRRVADEVRRYEEARVANDSTYWLIFELLWRDYFRFLAQKHGAALFQVQGVRGLPIGWSRDRARFAAWAEGRTGYPLVDAAMQELVATGYTSNRARQNVASFLTKNLGIDWRMGAEWFESLLVDYDPCSNYGNWSYTAGVGNDGRGFRYFDVPKQSREYDPDGEYVKHWLPALRPLPREWVHRPWAYRSDGSGRVDFQIGRDYPRPVVDLAESLEANRRRYEEALIAVRHGRPDHAAV